MEVWLSILFQGVILVQETHLLVHQGEEIVVFVLREVLLLPLAILRVRKVIQLLQSDFNL